MKRGDDIYNGQYQNCIVLDVIDDNVVLLTADGVKAVKKKDCKLIEKEEDLQSQVEKYCQENNLKINHMRKGRDGTTRTQRVAWPDCVILKGGKTYLIELKTGSGVLTPDQKKFQQWCWDNSFQYYVCRSFRSVVSVLDDTCPHRYGNYEVGTGQPIVCQNCGFRYDL